MPKNKNYIEIVKRIRTVLIKTVTFSIKVLYRHSNVFYIIK